MTAPKRRWFRISLRKMVVAVTGGTILAGSGAAAWMRAESMHRRSREHNDQAVMFWQVVEGLDRLTAPLNPKQQALREQFSEKCEYHASLSEEYEKAAWRPWVSVADDEAP
jgi:hypothetical protein